MSRLFLRVSAGIFTAALCCLIVARPASAETRGEAVAAAYAYAWHPWILGPENRTASCDASYRSELPVGDHLGLPYDWGGFVTIHDSACTYGLILAAFESMMRCQPDSRIMTPSPAGVVRNTPDSPV